ncbi:DUF5928 domain-containing protein [Pseudoprimorskyibacter insulae]|uniref:Peptide O-xylosyltransferase n=1 Tax=Pseudoprimorskyibacter insulae TaxID=1695997 RepID=A0A2R8ATR0_9RHOB|nr:DUF5928 domain-containing protein [Pseudoprimorskyibacter insulae]SPF79418.1 hypothetical protein PRI8871_01214 [Pseudoprimorskyibacter insulae]
MARIAFILLCHRDPEAVIKQARRLTAAGDYIAIHFDGNANDDDFRKITQALQDNPSVCFADRRVNCGWGEWSLVEATLQALNAAVRSFPRASHFYLMSGDCMAIKSAEYAHNFLDAADQDYIESFDFFTSDWIKTGIKEERLIYRHLFNERKNKKLFYASMALQKRMGLQRNLPDDMQIQIGSQWWCLRRRTIETILDYIAKNRRIVRFFRTTWIPDETFFQTLVRHLVPASEINSRTLTFLMFTDYGMPVTFYNDHYDMLLSQDFLFARKISPDARELKRRLGVLYSSKGTTFEMSNEGRTLYDFLAKKGRIGHRFGPRFWETEATLGRSRELLIVVAKKWHVGKRFTNAVRAHTAIPVAEYLFNEETLNLPDLGGIENSLLKRHRHRRALLRLMYSYYKSDRLLICMDPSSTELIEDFCTDKATVRLLEIETEFTDDYLTGHAKRVGLAGPHTPRDTFQRLLPSIRNDLAQESEKLREMKYSSFNKIRETNRLEVNARALAEFLSTTEDTATRIANTDELFKD